MNQIFLRIFVLFFCMMFFCSCLTPGMGIQRIENKHIPTISMVTISDILKREFPDYRIELKTVPETSVYNLDPSDWGWIYIEPHLYIVMCSKENNIILQYKIKETKKKSPFVGIYIYYYLKGEIHRERITELIEPMARLKKCLVNNFPEKINDNDFTEEFLPVPHQVRGWQYYE